MDTYQPRQPRHGVTLASRLVIGFLKGKSAVRIHRHRVKSKRVRGQHFWSRGYGVSTVGLDEQTIREYIRKQEEIELLSVRQ